MALVLLLFVIVASLSHPIFSASVCTHWDQIEVGYNLDGEFHRDVNEYGLGSPYDCTIAVGNTYTSGDHYNYYQLLPNDPISMNFRCNSSISGTVFSYVITSCPTKN